MKFKKAAIRNFRLLRNVDITFSTDEKTHLTIIRAANDSGKTTTLTALQWGLYGDRALPNKGRDFRLAPLDWDRSKNSVVDIQVIIEFEHYKQIPLGAGKYEHETIVYRLIRSAVETLHSDIDYSRIPSTVSLFELTDQGDLPITKPEVILDDIMPAELREVFFTDGDRALSFIEAESSLSLKRKRVKGAIRSLLGLDIIESALDHAKAATRVINEKLARHSKDSNLATIATELSDKLKSLDRLNTAYTDCHDKSETNDGQLAEIEININNILVRGNEEDLKNERDKNIRLIQYLSQQREDLDVKKSDLLFKQSIAYGLTNNTVDIAMQKLNSLKSKGTIPSSTISVLQERMKTSSCFCGESIDEHTTEGLKRHNHLKDVIQNSQSADEKNKVLGELFYDMRSVDAARATFSDNWREEYLRLIKSGETLKSQTLTAEKTRRDIDLKLGKLKGTNHAELKSLKSTLKQAGRELDEKKGSLGHRIKLLERDLKDLEARREKAGKSEKLKNSKMSELDAARDIVSILEETLQNIQHEELDKVSEKMNQYFLEMICSDPEQGAIIRKAHLTRDYDILVYGPKGQKLNPDVDINGASRRALTLSFILALTTVSGYESPNVIDTPLGMTTDEVKRSILLKSIAYSNQLVLFLTRSEIYLCEDILDDAGVVQTMTNSAHFPEKLASKPPTEYAEVLVCSCNHRQYCSICSRIGDDKRKELSYRNEV